MDAMDNEEALRLLVQRKLRDGLLPHDRFSIVWSGPSAGETCDACDVSLTKHQLLLKRPAGIAGVQRRQLRWSVPSISSVGPSSSRTLLARAIAVKGFTMNSSPGSRTSMRSPQWLDI